MNTHADLDRAIIYAVEHHAGQKRKGTDLPYILHPLETMEILASMGADTGLLMAGVLHDTVEDTAATLEELTELFGSDVSSLVGHHSEDKSKSWTERKISAIAALHDADKRLKMLVMADKVSNLRSTAADFRAMGDRVWERFNAPKERQRWYYGGMVKALSDMQNYPDTAAVYQEMTALYDGIYPPAENADGEYRLYGSRNRALSLTLRDGKMIFSGQDFGDDDLFGDYEYEFFYSIPEEMTPLMLALLREEYGADIPMKQVFKAAFVKRGGGEGFREYCEDHGIPFTFHSC